MRGRSRARRLVCAGLLLSSLASCAEPRRAPKGTLSVATGVYPVELLARRIGGDVVKVTNVTPPGAEPHDLELKPSDVRLLQSADLVLAIGHGFQPAIERVVGNRSNAYDVLTDLPLESAPPGEELSVDPHVWLDPLLMLKMAGTVLNVIATNRQNRQAELRERYATLKRDLETLDQEFTAKLRSCARREIFTSHAAFAYLAKRYRLRQVAITGINPEAEPSSKRLQEIARRARDAGATTIFFETLVSPRVSQAVARIVGAKTAVLDPVEGVTSKDDDYFTVMRRNLAALAGALGCTS